MSKILSGIAMVASAPVLKVADSLLGKPETRSPRPRLQYRRETKEFVLTNSSGYTLHNFGSERPSKQVLQNHLLIYGYTAGYEEET